MNTMPKMLRSAMAMLLALCLILGNPMVAMAAGEASAAEDAVATAEKYGPLADQVVDLMISNFFEDAMINEIFISSLTDDDLKTAIIEVIAGKLDEHETMLTDYGMEPTPENKELLATTIYDIAVNYHDATKNHTKNLEAGLRQACVETIKFALTEVEEQENADAALHYDLYVISKTEGHEAAVKEAEARLNKEYKPGDINGDGKVNNKDVTVLFQKLSGWNVKVVEDALDVNADGKVNNKDVTVLFQYVSGWNVEIH